MVLKTLSLCIEMLKVVRDMGAKHHLEFMRPLTDLIAYRKMLESGKLVTLE